MNALNIDSKILPIHALFYGVSRSASVAPDFETFILYLRAYDTSTVRVR